MLTPDQLLLACQVLVDLIELRNSPNLQERQGERLARAIEKLDILIWGSPLP